MSKEKNNKKESAKKLPLLNLKEKRAAKALKREGKNSIETEVIKAK